MNDTTVFEPDAPSYSDVGRSFARRNVAFGAGSILAGLACIKILIQLAGVNRYGFFRDELYYMACGQHLAWGYVDQPPLIALVAWLERYLFGNSLTAVRSLPIVAGAAVVWLTGVLARELGGGRWAQFLAATSILLAPAYLAFDSFLSMNAFEPLFWLLCALLSVKIVKGASPTLWMFFGVLAGVGLENKHSMLVFGFGLAAGFVLSGEHQLFQSKWIWIGAAIALALFLPNLIWEIRHGFPQIEVVRNAQRFKNEPVSPLQFLFEQVLFLDPVALPVWLAGLGWYFSKAGKRFRFLGWAYLITLAIFMCLGGKTYYPLPAYPVLMASGAVALETLFEAGAIRWLRLILSLVLITVGLVTMPFGVPMLPVRSFLRYSRAFPYSRSVKTERDATAELPQLYADMFGWENIAQTVAGVYHALPASEQAGCAILAGNYGEAGAIDYYGPKLGLPRAISGHNAYFYWGPRGYSGSCVVIFGERASEFAALFGESKLVATVNNPDAMPVEQNVPVYLCRKPEASLAVLWPHFKLII